MQSLVPLVVALAISVVFGLFAPKMWNIDTKGWTPWVWVRQFWLNFAGSFAGWFCLWLLWGRTVDWIDAGYDVALGAWEMFLFVVGFVGVTGILPYTTMKAIDSVGELLKRLPKPKE